MLGDIFKEAREAKGVTASEVAAETRMMMQQVEALEREDFSKVAAAAYAKGFIRLYSDYLGLDPEPMLAEYVEKFMPVERQPLLPDEAESSNNSPSDDKGFSLTDISKIEWPFTFSKRLFAGVASAVSVLLLLIILLTMVFRGREESAQEVVEIEAPVPQVVVSRTGTALIQDPPEPFIDLYKQR